MEESISAVVDEQMESTVSLSKRQLKRTLKRQERESNKEDWKRMKRQKLKEAKQRKRLQNGPPAPMDSPIRIPSRKERVQAFLDKKPFMNVIIDMGFQSLMNPKERSSLNVQLCRCYGENKRAVTPVKLILSSVDTILHEELEKHSVDQWKGLQLVESHWSQLPDASQFVYLTADSPHLLETFEEGTTYIIGGLVDKNRHKRVTLDAALQHGIKTARLPIREHVQLTSSCVMTVNQGKLVVALLGSSYSPEPYR